MPWPSILFSSRDESEYAKSIVVLISHTGTLSLTPRLAYVFICYVVRIQDFYNLVVWSPLWAIRHVVYA